MHYFKFEAEFPPNIECKLETHKAIFPLILCTLAPIVPIRARPGCCGSSSPPLAHSACTVCRHRKRRTNVCDALINGSLQIKHGVLPCFTDGLSTFQIR